VPGLPDVTVAEAASWFGAAKSTVRNWISRQRITSVGKRGNEKTYRFDALAKAERQAGAYHGARNSRFRS
jgi:hypothetical protein